MLAAPADGVVELLDLRDPYRRCSRDGEEGDLAQGSRDIADPEPRRVAHGRPVAPCCSSYPGVAGSPPRS